MTCQNAPIVLQYFKKINFTGVGLFEALKKKLFKIK